MREFPEFATAPHASLVALDEEWMKSKEGKERWRGFINTLRALSCLFGVHLLTPGFRYEKKITDYNFGSLIRTDAMKEYSESNTIFGPFVRF